MINTVKNVFLNMQRDALKATSKRVIQKATAVAGGFIDNKILGVVAKPND